jgi:hypothetical protein
MEEWFTCNPMKWVNDWPVIGDRQRRRWKRGTRLLLIRNQMWASPTLFKRLQSHDEFNGNDTLGSSMAMDGQSKSKHGLLLQIHPMVSLRVVLG